MTDTPPYADLLSLTDDRSAALRDAVAAALHGRVPYDALRVDGDRAVLAALRDWSPVD